MIDIKLVFSLSLPRPLILLITYLHWVNYTIIALEIMHWSGLQVICKTVNNMCLIMSYHPAQELQILEHHKDIFLALFFFSYIWRFMLNCKITTSALFAGDTKLFVSGTNLQTIASNINHGLIYISPWLKVNQLSLPVTKHSRRCWQIRSQKLLRWKVGHSHIVMTITTVTILPFVLFRTCI